MKHYSISSEKIDLETVQFLITSKTKIALSDSARNKISACRTYLDEKLKRHPDPIYGINTGFGSLCETKISNDDLSKLQENLVMSHACGTGERVPSEIVKMMLLLKIQGLSYGHSGVQLCTVERLVDFYNHDILPVVYDQGSLGASGDLAPLAHLCLPLIGMGEVYWKGNVVPTSDMLRSFNWHAIKLQSKEGLALLNGTQFMSAYGVWCLLQSKKLSKWSDTIAAMSLDAFNG